MPINPDFKELLSEFNARDVRYLVVGGYAFAFHAKPRTTKDMDIWVEPSAKNARAVWNALAKFGAPMRDVTTQDFETVGTVYQIGQPPNRIDILTRIEAVSFDDAWSSRVAGKYDDVPVWYIGRELLVRNKKALGRLQDLADVETLEFFANSPPAKKPDGDR
jgi:hypothetical protein